MLIKVYIAHFRLKNPSHYSQTRKTSFPLKNTQFLTCIFLKKSSKDSCSCSLCHHLPSFLKLLQASIYNCRAVSWTVGRIISHGIFWFGHNQARVSYQYSSIHLLEYQGTAVSTQHNQTTTKSSLFFKSSKISNLFIVEIVLCLLKISPCWLQWNLNRGKWLHIEREKWI